MGEQRLSGLARDGAAWRLVVCLGFVLLLGLPGAGCKRGGPPPLPLRVVQVQVAGAVDPSVSPAAGAAGAEAALDEEALQAAARRGLQRAGINHAATGEGQPGDFKLRLEVLLQRAPAQTGVEVPPLRVLCAGQLRARAGSALAAEEASKQPAPELSRLQHVVAAERTQKTGEGDAPWAQLAQRVVEETAATLGEQLRLLGQPSSLLIQVAGDRGRDESVRAIALQLLGLRKERAAVPVLIAVVKEPEKQPEKAAAAQRTEATEPGSLRDHAIGALVEIGDPSAVRPLLDVVQLGDSVEVAKILEAVAALGGDEARRYLEFVSVSHSDERVRADAKTALGHLTKRQARRDGGS